MKSTYNILNSVLKVGGMTMLSRVLGLIRDTLSAIYLGVSSYSDAFFVAFKLPNVFRSLFAEGGLNSIFTPLFSDLANNNSKEEALKFANEIFTILVTSLIILITLMEVFMPQVLFVIAPGFKQKFPNAYNVAIILNRITLPFLFFISLSTLFSCILNSIKKFVIPAVLPLILNLTIIICFLISKYFNYENSAAYLGAFGVSLAGIIQLIFIWYCTKKLGWNVKLTSLKKLTKSTKLFFTRMLPLIVSSGVYQLNIFINITIASWLAAGSISYLYYADRLNQLPLAIIGIAISTVIVPFISGKQHSIEENYNIKNNAFIYGIGLGLPAVLGFLVLGKEIITILFNYGRFGYESISKTYIVLVLYSLGLIPNILIKISVSIFYAEGNTKIPFTINSLNLIINTALAILLSIFLGVQGIALATTISASISLIALFYFLCSKNYIKISKKTVKEIFKIVVITLLLFVVIYFIKIEINNYLFNNTELKLKKIVYNTIFIIIIIITMMLWIFSLKIVKSQLYYELLAIFVKKYRNKIL